LHPK